VIAQDRAAIAQEQQEPQAALLAAPRPRRLWAPPSLAVELLLAAAVVGISLVGWPALQHLGETTYQDFLQLQWLLVDGGKGLHLDWLSLPLPPLLYAAVAAAVGPDAAARWLPVVVDVAIVLLLTRLVLRHSPLPAKVMAAILVIASPLFYILQRQFDIQLYLLLLGLQFVTLRAFRRRPTVPLVTAAIAVNVVLSLTTYMALPALIAAIIYLLVLTDHQREVEPAAWRAFMWLYIPFSFAGYALWAVAWTVAGSRVETSYFIPTKFGDPSYLRQLLASVGRADALPMALLLALLAVAAVSFRQARTQGRADHGQALTWVALTYMGFTFGLVGLQRVVQALPIQVEVITFSLLLLVPIALASVYEQARPAFRPMRRPAHILMLAAASLAIIVFPLQYVLRPTVADDAASITDARQQAGDKAAAAFSQVDPGGRILLDPRFTVGFIRAAHIDPHRLLTPFDTGFPQFVANPPQDVRTIVVTDDLGDAVAGNYPSARVADLLPNATLIAQESVKNQNQTVFVRVFRRESTATPDVNAPTKQRDPAITQEENTVLAAVLNAMQQHGGLPIRPDGWAYAIDLGNLMVYAANLGDIALFRQLSTIVERDYLVTNSDDPNALYTVAWRHRPDRPNEASGTTETLRMVEAYWTAGERWDNDYYRRLAYLMAKAYARHQSSDQFGQGWFIRNYYNYGTKEYAANSYVVDYSPDVLRRAAERFGDQDLLATAKASSAFVTAAQLPSGLFHEMYQPEISTLYANITYFSPNGVVQLIDSIEATLGISQLSAPDRAIQTYQFAQAQFRHSSVKAMSNQFLMDGTSTGGPENTPAVYAYLVRLGVRLGDLQWPRELIAEKLGTARLTATSPDTDYNWFFAWTTVLLALREYQEA